jgi:DNA polymerase-3 subunit gamma/tau
LFEQVMRGEAAGALAAFRNQYDLGADPATVLSELANFNHLVTRLKFIPTAADDASLSEDERMRGSALAGSLSVRVLSRAWQMLLKGIPEVQTSSNPVAAAEMVLIRLAHAANLPTLDEMVRSLDSGEALPSAPQRPAAVQAAPRGPAGTSSGGAAAAVAQARMPAATPNGQTMRLVESSPDPMPRPEPVRVEEAEATPAVAVRSLADIAALAEANRDLAFKVQFKRCVRLVKVEPGRLDVSLTDDAPKALLGDLTTRLKNWTGRTWLVSLSRDQGSATLAEDEAGRRESALLDARNDPTVMAILAQFPGAKVVDVRIPDTGTVAEEAQPDLPPEPAADDDEL